jgi:hypothetical protein
MIKRKKWWKIIGIMLFRRRVGSALTTKKFVTSSNICVATILLWLEKVK